MRYLLAIPLLLIGALLLSLTNDGLDFEGKLIINLLGWGSFMGAILIGGRRKKKKKELT
ncbi:hypothetical protein [Fredinandcohnia sp. 179-A 10B2 NHS]|uniref:hypothetical protein n=1 Tax=Fredinandcohnia sp. 179-A 10B2 NHS TaxID=3235176 RepID=UPI0039A0BEA8